MIKVDDRYLNERVGEINSALINMEASINNLYSIISRIDFIWDGRDNDLFNVKSDDALTDLRNLLTSIESHNDFLKTYLESVVSLDREYQNISINNLV